MQTHISTDFEQMNFDLIYGFLSQSYWSKGMPKSVLKKACENSLCFAIFADKQQVGFARMITDRSTFAYLADVFILLEYRGKGLSKQLMDFIMAHSDLQGLRRMMLATADAHGLYQQYGFTPLNDEKLFMESWDPDVYQSSQKNQ